VISSHKQRACDEVAPANNARHGSERAVAIATSISDKAALEAMVTETRASAHLSDQRPNGGDERHNRRSPR